MNQRSFALLAAILLLSPLMTGLACAQTAATPATAPTTAPTAAPASATPAATEPASNAGTGQKHPTLVVLNAKGAQLQGKTLSLDGVSASAIVFADRPIRRAGYMRTSELVKLWAGGTFAQDPPNATISAFTKDGSRLADAVVVLKSPRMVDGKLTFNVAVLEGNLGGADGPASMFIDTIWFGIGGDGVNYIGRNQTTGGTAPAFGSKNDTSNPGGWPNPAPSSPPRPTTSPPPPNAAPLTTPPAGSH